MQSVINRHAFIAAEFMEGMLRVDEVDQALLRSIDEAILSDLTELRIIHGKGTGAVRARVTALLEIDARVSAFRVGGRAEGGAGVTVASFG
ncbi:MAG: Smr/MutS family protein [Gemmatimonadetes bacterium]|nr:Smr/MutS family protein [Gemmatimonadota bacterium]